MWYSSYLPWENEESRYDIRYAESISATVWRPLSGTCLSHRWATGRPCVIKEGSDYLMWFCHRGKETYRFNPETAYRIGYAISLDGRTWNLISGDEFEGQQCDDWESTMQCYPYVYRRNGETHMLYNGNGFGQTGIGHAVWED